MNPRTGEGNHTFSRATYFTLAIVTIAIGLLVHLRGGALGPVVQDVLADAMWAMMIAWWAGVCAPRSHLVMRSAAALAVCVVVELSQRYHTPMLDAVRATRVGHLILGSGFDPRDLAAYAIGVGVAAYLDARLRGGLISS